MIQGNVTVKRDDVETIFAVSPTSDYFSFAEQMVEQGKLAARHADIQRGETYQAYLTVELNGNQHTTIVTSEDGYRILHSLSTFLDGQFWSIRMMLKHYGDITLPVPEENSDSVRPFKSFNRILPILRAELNKWHLFAGQDEAIMEAARGREKTYSILRNSKEIRSAKPSPAPKKKNFFARLMTP